jgi:hypothetical protein
MAFSESLLAYRRLYDAGLTVEARRGKLLVGPASKLNDELRALVRQHKVAMLGLLAEAERTTSVLLRAAMRACDAHRDGPAAREEMRAACVGTPLHLRGDLLDHLRHTYGPMQGARASAKSVVDAADVRTAAATPKYDTANAFVGVASGCQRAPNALPSGDFT